MNFTAWLEASCLDLNILKLCGTGQCNVVYQQPVFVAR